MPTMCKKAIEYRGQVFQEMLETNIKIYGFEYGKKYTVETLDRWERNGCMKIVNAMCEQAVTT